MRRRYLVCYDIADPVRLRRVHKKMKGFGDALQYSVFCCELTTREKVEMESELSDIINHKEDRVLVVDLGSTEIDQKAVFQFMGNLGTVIREATLII